MRTLTIYLLLISFVLGQSCARRRTFVLTDNGNIKRTTSNNTKYSSHLGPYDVDYFLLYNKNLTTKDTAELKAIVDNFIRTIKRKKFIKTKHLDNSPLVFQNDTIGHLAINMTGWRDHSATFELNLKTRQIRYVTSSGF